MSFANIKTKLQAQDGFTIVELLIVIVVIAILAAITIVSYNGITARANSSSAQAMASGVAKKAEAFAADATSTGYPSAFSQLTASTSAPYAVGGGISSVLATGSLNATNGKNTVQYTPCGTGAANTAPTTQATVTVYTGAVINYRDYSNDRNTLVTLASPATTATDPAGLTAGQVTGSVGSKAIGCPAS